MTASDSANPLAFSLCVATFKRPEMLHDLLASIEAQDWHPDPEAFEIVVVDNDESKSAEPIVAAFAARSRWPVVYESVMPPNISVARNACLKAARQPAILFVDDDQLLPPRTLSSLRDFWSQQDEGVSGCQFSRKPVFASDAPAWIKDADVFEQYDRIPGAILPAHHLYVSGVFFRRRVFEDHGLSFDPALGLMGGEDNRFFHEAGQHGEVFVGNGIEILERIPAQRAVSSYVLRRHFNSGRQHAAFAMATGPLAKRVFYPMSTALMLLGALLIGPVLSLRGKAGLLEAQSRVVRQCGKVAWLVSRSISEFYRGSGDRIRSLYFHARPHHRLRQRETVQNRPAEVLATSPRLQHYVVETKAMFRSDSLRQRLKDKGLATLFPLGLRPIRDASAKTVDAIFTWGVIPLGRKPYVIELENPYQLCMYEVAWFRRLSPIIRRFLLAKRCLVIACISEACKRTLAAELGDQVAAKVKILYPYMDDHAGKRQRQAGGRLEFLFVATLFRNKGGLEAARAFNRVAAAHGNIHLTMVTNISDELRHELEAPGFITVVAATMDRDTMHRDYFAKADVFLLPTSHDSSPMVILEAVSFGIPVISSRVYAIPEMVVHGETGLLIEPGFEYFDRSGRANERHWTDDGMREATSKYYDHVERQVAEAIVAMLDQPRREAMGAKARALFLSRFAPDVWRRSYLALLDGSARR